MAGAAPHEAEPVWLNVRMYIQTYLGMYMLRAPCLHFAAIRVRFCTRQLQRKVGYRGFMLATAFKSPSTMVGSTYTQYIHARGIDFHRRDANIQASSASSMHSTVPQRLPARCGLQTCEASTASQCLFVDSAMLHRSTQVRETRV